MGSNLLVESYSIRAIPEGTAIAGGVGRNPRAPQTHVAGPDERDAKAGTDVPHHLGVGFIPLVGKEHGETLESCLGLNAQEAVSRGNKGSEVTTLCPTRRAVLPHLLLLPATQNSGRFGASTGCSIEISNGEVEDAVRSAALPKATDEEVTTKSRDLSGRGGRGGRGSTRVSNRSRATSVD